MPNLKTALTTFIALAAASPALSMGHAGTKGYALAEDGATLVTMTDIAVPGCCANVCVGDAPSGDCVSPCDGPVARLRRWHGLRS